MTYGVLSDLHCHAWSTFAHINPDGVNNRLRLITDEILRAAKEVSAAKGHTLIIAGDIFHVRGAIDPEVLNPVQRVFREILNNGISIHAIPGNHDLKTKETSALSSAIETLAETFSTEGSFTIHNTASFTSDDGHSFAFVPWRSNSIDLLNDLSTLSTQTDKAQTDVFIHAGIDGVLPGMPDHGLSAQKLGQFGFRHVFAGHYHNHVEFEHGVVSIGATTHQTWSDVGTRAGFLIVDNAGAVTFHRTHAPEFVDVTGKDEAEMAMLADGNYVRFRDPSMSQTMIKELKQFLLDSGARGTSISVPKEQVSARVTTNKVAGTTLTLDQSVQGFIDASKTMPAHIDRDEVKRQAADVLAQARSTYEEA